MGVRHCLALFGFPGHLQSRTATQLAGFPAAMHENMVQSREQRLRNIQAQNVQNGAAWQKSAHKLLNYPVLTDLLKVTARPQALDEEVHRNELVRTKKRRLWC